MPPARDVAIGLGLGAGGYAVQAGCYFAALERIDASLLSLLVYTFPALVAVGGGRARARAALAAARRRRWSSPRRARAGRRRAGSGALDPLGAALGLAAAVLYATYILVSDGLSQRDVRR